MPDGQSSTSDGLPTLYVLGPSHFCERARFGLDAAGIAHREVRWPVGLHGVLARRIAPDTSLPILAAPDGVVQGSDRILDWTGLPGAAPEIEGRCERVIGPLVRQYIYAGVLTDPASRVRDALLDGVAVPLAIAGRAMWPVTRRIMIARMQALPDLLPSLTIRLEEELDWFDRHLAGRDYLSGDGFGRADITAASLLAPLARPAGGPDYARVTLPQPVETALGRWAERPALRFVRRIYADHRRLVTRPAAA
jgi:glutathione S-transferase